MAQAYTAPDWGTGEGISPSNLQAISNTLEAIVQGADRAIHHIDIAEGNTTVTYIDGTVETYAISGLRGISNVIKRTDGAVDTYTIVYTDGTSYTFNITNGTDGNGIIGILEIPDPTIPINVKKYRILFTDGTHFDYEVRDGINGRNGQDGVGITDIRETKTDNIHTITIILSNGQAVEFEIADGINTEEAAEVIAARGEYQSLKQRLDTSDSKVWGLKEDLNQTNATLKASSTTTSNEELDYSIDGNIVSADFVGYARKSKNLLECTMQTTTKYGITCTRNADGTYTLNGTSTALCEFNMAITLASGKYKVVGAPSGSNFTGTYGAYLHNADYSIQAIDNGSGSQITLTETKALTYAIVVRANKTLSNVVFKPMITTDTSATYNDYEPYGIIKPSGVVESHNKNLWLYENTKVQSIGLVNSKALQYFDKPNTYTFSHSGGNVAEITYNIFNKITNTNKFASSQIVGKGFTETVAQNEVLIIFGYNGLSVSGFNNLLPNAQIEVGSVATKYTEGHSSTIQLPYTPLGIGEIKDELIVYADGTGKFVKRINEIDLSTLNWQMSSSTQGGFYAEQSRGTLLDYKLINNVPSICSIYEYQGTINQGSTALVNNGNYALFYLSSTQNLEGIYMRDTKYSSVADFKTSLNGVLLYYELATPQEIALTQAQVEQILALKTFADVTYIDADGLTYELGYIINAGKAIKDLKDIIKALTSTQTLDVADNASETMSAMPSKSVNRIDLKEITEEQTEEPTE